MLVYYLSIVWHDDRIYVIAYLIKIIDLGI